MCGIVGAIAQRPVAAILLEGLKRLEYRGYDSAGLAVLSSENGMRRLRTLGKVSKLVDACALEPLDGTLGIAHTRWATHGEPSTENAHPHLSGERCAIVHNGIIENHARLRAEQMAAGHKFTSQTDTEVIVHAIYDELAAGHSLVEAVRRTTVRLDGAYALGVIDARDPTRLIAARQGSPLVIGIGFQEHFIASDVFALLPVTNRFMFLEEGDLAELGSTASPSGTATARSSSVRCGNPPSPPIPPSVASTATSCRRRSSSSRAPSPTRSKGGSAPSGCCRRPSGWRPRPCSPTRRR
jgi:glutamine---fructose-6-phosphate transaminase (isomerizing)